MAESKAKRSFSLAQPKRPLPNPQPDELMPVKVHVYRTLAELNAGFEKVLQDLHTLSSVSYFRSSGATAAHRMISRIRAQLNQEFAMTLHERETANADHFERLCAGSKDQIGT